MWTYVSTLSFLNCFLLIHDHLCQLETEVGDRLRNDVMVFLNDDNSSITYRINSLQSRVRVITL